MSAARRQRGAALLVLLVIAVIAFTMVLVTGMSRWFDPTTASRNVNADVLAQAKTALIGYIAKEALDVSEDVPGRFPCPESASVAGTSGEGVAAATCTPGAAVQKTLGRLPWRTLGSDKLVDAAAEPLWYAVSPNWVSGGLTTLNPGTAGQFSFDGTGNVVAVIFAPGRPIAVNPTAAQIAAGCAARNQTRTDRTHVATSSANPDYRDYVECLNAASPVGSAFGVAVTGNDTNPVINDQAVVITDKEVLNALQGPLAERMQRTVAPLLSEFSDQWIGGSKFMPYAVAFSPPEAGLASDSYCGPSAATQQSEGLLPIAPTTSAACASGWTGSFTGDGINSLGCDTNSPVTCSFQYFQLTPLAQFLFGIVGAGSVTATLQGTAPHAAASFRAKSVQSAADVTVTAGAATLSAFSIAPQTTGDVAMSIQATVSSTNLCKESLVGGILCSTLGGLGLANPTTVSLRFAQLPTPTLSGSKLSTAAKNGRSSFDLLAPSAGDPHYWFIRNEWYRYTYYAVAPGSSAAQSGGNLTVNLFPAAYGATNDKRFVLALMGPAVTGQTRSPTAAMNQYVEGQNAVTGGSPRTFAYQVFTASGNDRVATCPFASGASICD
ncbi:MAG TPA: hypothetical protein VFI86_05795 [Burkholderiales bacterium]|nr:hypothetical protein [Burkholderiales bacterium]